MLMFLSMSHPPRNIVVPVFILSSHSVECRPEVKSYLFVVCVVDLDVDLLTQLEVPVSKDIKN